MFIQKRSSIAKTASTGLLLLSLGLMPLTTTAQTQTSPDNSATNRGHNQGATADQQKNNVSDRDLTAKIRRAVIADKSLSMYGHNVKIIVAGGSATLEGPVHSEAEKQAIGHKAAEVVGADKVSNEITVK